jgi:hypothetical protein
MSSFYRKLLTLVCPFYTAVSVLRLLPSFQNLLSSNTITHACSKALSATLG